MKIGVTDLIDRVQTGRAIYALAEYYRDLGSLLDLSLQDFYTAVKKMPYVENPPDKEIVSRPKYIIEKNVKDCKSASVLIGAYLNAHNIKWRLVAVSERPNREIHHVFVQAYIKGKWMNIDATYPEYRLFQAKPDVTEAEELPR